MILLASAQMLCVLLQTAATQAPPAADLLAKARAAIGVAAHPPTSIAGQGRVRRVASGAQSESPISWALLPPDKLLRREEWSDDSGVRAVRTIGYDGQVMWSMTHAIGTARDKAVRVREDPSYRWQMAAYLDREARAYSLIFLADAGPVAALRSAEPVQASDGACWIVEVVAGSTHFSLCVDRVTFRPSRVRFRNNQPGVEAEPIRDVELRVSGHRQVLGLFLPERLTRVVDGVTEEEIDMASFRLDAFKLDDFKRPDNE
jgi:hypothetical protein